MNILYLVHRIPFPPDKGDKLRSFRQLEHLAKRHRVWCACFVDSSQDRRFIEPLAAHCHELVTVPIHRGRALFRSIIGLLRGATITESIYADPAFASAIDEWASTVSFDAVVAFSSGMAPHALRVSTERRVLDMCDLDSQKWLAYAAASRGPVRWLFATEGKRLAVRERYWLQAFDATILITEAEAQGIATEAHGITAQIVGNGVSLPDLTKRTVNPTPLMRNPLPSDEPRASARAVSHLLTPVISQGKRSGRSNHHPGMRVTRPTVGFVGVMDYRPNVDAVCWFVRYCWPRISEAFPEAVFRIVGRLPTRRVRKLTAVAGVDVVGAVADVTSQVLRFDVSVAPMRIARGLQNKVLEAMAAAKPVVLTNNAAEGISARSEREFLVADDPDRIADCVISLLDNPTMRARIGAAARQFVEKHHRWEDELRKFERIITGMLRSDAPTRLIPRQMRSSPLEQRVAQQVPSL